MNYMRIQDLKEQVSSLEGQIRESVAGLAGLREELLAVGRRKADSGGLVDIGVDGRRPETVKQVEARPVPLSELLDYANRISRFTVPPAKQGKGQQDRQEDLQRGASKKTSKDQGEDVDRGILPINDAERRNSLNGKLEAGKSPRVESDKSEGAASATIPGGDTGIGIAALTEPERNWQLQNAAALPFVPWPNDEMIRIGGLARVQSLLEKGKELEDLDGAGRDEGGDSAVIKSESNEKQNIQRKESADNMEYGLEFTAWESRQKQEAKQRPAVFGGLDLYDPDEP